MAVDQVKRLYESMPSKLDAARRRFGRPLTLAEKILVAHADDFAKQEWSRGKAQLRLRVDRVSLQDATGADGAAAVHAGGQAAGGGAVDGALRSPHPGADGRRRGHAARDHREQRGLRLPALGLEEVRHRLLEAGRGHHPPGGARELRVPGRPHDRHGLAYAQCGRPRHDRHRRGRGRLRRGHGRARLGGARPEADRRAPDRQALGVDLGQGRDHLSAGAPHRQGRHQQDRRVLRSGRGLDQRHRQGHDLQHGRGARRDDLAVPLRRPDGRVSPGHRSRRHRRAGRGTIASTWWPIPRCRPIPRSTTTRWWRSTSPSSSPTSSARIRPTARARSPSSPPR